MEGHGNFHGGYSWDTGNEADDADFEAKLQAVTGSQTYQTYPPLQGSVPTTADTYRYGQNGGCYPPTLLHNNEGWTRDGALGNGDYTNDSSTSSLRRSRLSAPQRIRTRVGNETLESPHYISHTQYIGYPTQNLPKGNSQWVAASPHITADFQQKPVRYTTEHQRFRGNIPYNQTTPFQAAVNLGHGNQKSGEMLSPRREQDVHRDSPATQALGYPQPSSMQHLVARRIRVSASSTLTNSTTASGSTGGTFSSVSAREEGSLLDAPQPSNLGYQLSQLQIADNTVDVDGNSQTMQPSRSSHGVHVYASASYGQVPAMMAAQPISQQDACSHCHACMHTHCYASHQSAHYGDHAAIGVVRIGYCPKSGCNRGPGSRRPFPRTCNLLEHLRGVHREDIPRGAKLRGWLLDQGYNPDLLVAYAKPRS